LLRLFPAPPPPPLLDGDDFETCVNADAAADLAAGLDFGSLNTFPALLAAFAPVVSFVGFFAIF
jgi:hypothetical protein